MSIIQALVGSIVSSGSGGDGPPPAPTAYPPTLTAMSGSLFFQNNQQSYLALTDNQADWAVGTSDYTIEWQQWMLDTSSTVCRVFSLGTWPSASLALSLENGNAIFWGQGGGSSNLVGTFAYQFSTLHNDWVHIAIVRVSGTTTIYFNGQQVWSTNVSYNVTTNDNLYIGNQSALDAGFSGYIKDFRFIAGVGLYTTNFAPPLEPLAVTGQTVALFSMSDFGSRFADSTGRHNTTSGGLTYEDIGPYALALLVDANDPASYNIADSGNWNDLSSLNHDITVGGGTWSTGNPYTMFDFGTSAQGYDAGNTALVQTGMTPRISMSFWAHIAPHSEYQHIAGFRGTNKFHIVVYPNNTYLECRIETQGGAIYDLPTTTIGSTINTMAHYAFVANGTRMDFYVNGVLVSTNDVIGGTFDGTLGAFSLARAAGGFQAQGLKVGYARVDNRARGPLEILREFNTTRATYGYI